MAIVLLLLAALVLPASSGMAQNPATAGPGAAAPTARAGSRGGDFSTGPAPDSLSEGMQARQAQRQNEQRYAELKRDTDRLLQLATELKLQVDKAGQHTLSLEAIRKADEIEKLARSVRTKMKAQ
jgi:hypothetical protein